MSSEWPSRATKTGQDPACLQQSFAEKSRTLKSRSLTALIPFVPLQAVPALPNLGSLTNALISYAATLAAVGRCQDYPPTSMAMLVALLLVDLPPAMCVSHVLFAAVSCAPQSQACAPVLQSRSHYQPLSSRAYCASSAYLSLENRRQGTSNSAAQRYVSQDPACGESAHSGLLVSMRRASKVNQTATMVQAVLWGSVSAQSFLYSTCLLLCSLSRCRLKQCIACTYELCCACYVQS